MPSGSTTHLLCPSSNTEPSTKPQATQHTLRGHTHTHIPLSPRLQECQSRLCCHRHSQRLHTTQPRGRSSVWQRGLKATRCVYVRVGNRHGCRDRQELACRRAADGPKRRGEPLQQSWSACLCPSAGVHSCGCACDKWDVYIIYTYVGIGI